MNSSATVVLGGRAAGDGGNSRIYLLNSPEISVRCAVVDLQLHISAVLRISYLLC